MKRNWVSVIGFASLAFVVLSGCKTDKKWQDLLEGKLALEEEGEVVGDQGSVIMRSDRVFKRAASSRLEEDLEPTPSWPWCGEHQVKVEMVKLRVVEEVGSGVQGTGEGNPKWAVFEWEHPGHRFFTASPRYNNVGVLKGVNSTEPQRSKK